MRTEAMQKLTRDQLMPLEQYARQRKDFRARVMAHKQNRQVQIGPHATLYLSLDAVEQAKGELVEALPADGTAILNADDARVRRMASRTVARVVTYGFDPSADVTASDVAGAGLAGMRFRLHSGGEERAAATPGLGRLSVHNALAAAAVGWVAGLSIDEVVAGLATGWSAPHRGEVIRAGDVTIIDDAYNASPGSVVAALELLAGLPGRPVAVLGEMLELGDGHDAGLFHRNSIGTP